VGVKLSFVEQDWFACQLQRAEFCHVVVVYQSTIDDVEALRKRHDEFAKALRGQDDKLNALDDLADRLIGDGHPDSALYVTHLLIIWLFLSNLLVPCVEHRPQTTHLHPDLLYCRLHLPPANPEAVHISFSRSLPSVSRLSYFSVALWYPL